jgi:type I restriction enzyme M protein
MPQNEITKAGSKPGTQLGFEAEMFKAADKLRDNTEPSDYKHVALGLIFLKYISNTFEAGQTAMRTVARQARASHD